MKSDFRSKLINRKIKKPNTFIAGVVKLGLGIANKLYGVKFSYDYDPATIKNQPTILMSTHASRLEFIYTVYGFGRKDTNIVCGYQNIMQKGLYPILTRLGVISKYLYQPDFACVKNMLRVLKRNGALALFPEGIQSTSGSTHPINPATVQFIKRSKANIVVCKTNGAYLATNRYSSDRKKGHIEANYSLLFTPSMLEELTEDQIYDRLLKKISYNDFEFNKTARNKYVGKKPNADGIDKILYKCPNCKAEHTLRVENGVILCRDCDLKIMVDEYYDLVDIDGNVLEYDIDAWYKWQRRCVKAQVEDDGFEMTMSAKLCTLKLDKLRKAPDNQMLLSVGTVSLTNKGLSFTGALDGKTADFYFKAQSLYSLTFSTKGYLEFYNNNEYYMIIPDKNDKCLIKWTLAAEEIHNLYDERWNSASADVYDYDKGDI